MHRCMWSTYRGLAHPKPQVRVCWCRFGLTRHMPWLLLTAFDSCGLIHVLLQVHTPTTSPRTLLGPGLGCVGWGIEMG